MQITLGSLFCVAWLTVSGCFYLSERNERPRPRIEEKTIGPYTITEEVIFSALGSADDRPIGESEFVWQAFACDSEGQNCETISNQETLPSASSEFVVVPTRKGSLRVDLLVRDSSGAFDKASATVPVINQDPLAELKISKNFPDPGDLGGHVLGLPIELAARLSDPDGDELTIAWNYDPPLDGGSNPANVVFEAKAGTDNVFVLIGDVAGVWTVSIRVTDGDGGISLAERQVVFAPDRPPCLASVSPAILAGQSVVLAAGPQVFSVDQAVDALDPFPPLSSPDPAIGETRFQWSLASRHSGGQLTPLVRSLSSLTIDPAEYTPGEVLTIRVEAFDRLNEPVACPTSEPGCAADNNECNQRMTWKAVIR